MISPDHVFIDNFQNKRKIMTERGVCLAKSDISTPKCIEGGGGPPFLEIFLKNTNFFPVEILRFCKISRLKFV